MSRSDDAWHELAIQVVRRRRNLGMRTQQDLADAAGVSKSTITRLERGRPLHRRSSSWELVEKALQWPEGYIERWVNEIEESGFLIRASDLDEIEPRARAIVKDALMTTFPDVKVAQVIAAEDAIVSALRRNGFLPDHED